MAAQIAGRQILKPRSTLSLTLEEPHDPADFYQCRSGLWVWDGFRFEVVVGAKRIHAGAKFDVSIFELVHVATSFELAKALPANHLFDESAVCALVATMIEKQPSGEIGDLETKGHANLLYTRACCVELLYDPMHRVWRILASRRDNIKWGVGRRVLAPAV
ncbi:hypothetical protein [Bradyrhizobium elkanii]|uniref:hypothetical protein n=1 Tax=Bradyrhizobium elkanii TaxID=29448 RepID=UPI0020A1787C|nr:hypothetical protein [Bradyrhizobium elkanii]MCP1926399.1 hypothetical protein [Bradyrhizobium elkanii]